VVNFEASGVGVDRPAKLVEGGRGVVLGLTHKMLLDRLDPRGPGISACPAGHALAIDKRTVAPTEGAPPQLLPLKNIKIARHGSPPPNKILRERLRR
jgi:hypothetical protein